MPFRQQLVWVSDGKHAVQARLTGDFLDDSSGKRGDLGSNTPNGRGGIGKGVGRCGAVSSCKKEKKKSRVPLL